MWGSQLLEVITYARWEGTQIHRGTQSHIKMSKICIEGVTQLSSGERCLFVSFSFPVLCTQTLMEHSLAPRLSCFF